MFFRSLPGWHMLTPTHTLHCKYLFHVARQCVDEAEGLFLTNTHPTTFAAWQSMGLLPASDGSLSAQGTPSAASSKGGGRRPVPGTTPGTNATGHGRSSSASQLAGTGAGTATVVPALDDEPMAPPGSERLPARTLPSAGLITGTPTPATPMRATSVTSRSNSFSAAPAMTRSVVPATPAAPPPWAWLHLNNWLADERPLCAEFALSEHQLDAVRHAQYASLAQLQADWMHVKVTVPADDLGMDFSSSDPSPSPCFLMPFLHSRSSSFHLPIRLCPGFR